MTFELVISDILPSNSYLEKELHFHSLPLNSSCEGNYILFVQADQGSPTVFYVNR